MSFLNFICEALFFNEISDFFKHKHKQLAANPVPYYPDLDDLEDLRDDLEDLRDDLEDDLDDDW